jgi:hypothetical protein
MKYIKRIFENHSDYELEKIVNNILSIDEVIKNDFKNISKKNKLQCDVEYSSLMHLMDTSIFEISRHLTKRYRGHYWEQLKEHEETHGDFDLESCSMKYLIGINASMMGLLEPNFRTGSLKTFMETLQRKYNHVEIQEEVSDTYIQIEVQYNLQYYVNLIRNNYLKINKE